MGCSHSILPARSALRFTASRAANCCRHRRDVRPSAPKSLKAHSVPRHRGYTKRRETKTFESQSVSTQAFQPIPSWLERLRIAGPENMGTLRLQFSTAQTFLQTDGGDNFFLDCRLKWPKGPLLPTVCQFNCSVLSKQQLRSQNFEKLHSCFLTHFL